MSEIVEELGKQGVGLDGCLSVDKYNAVVDALLRRQHRAEQAQVQDLCLDPVVETSTNEAHDRQLQSDPVTARFAQAKQFYLDELQKLRDKKKLLDNEFLRELEIYKTHQESLQGRKQTGE